MSSGTSPVVLDGRVSDEKLNELLALQAEYPEFDYKRVIDLSGVAGLAELAKDVGAMQVRGGYLIAGVDDHGAPLPDMDGIDTRSFDEASLVPKLLSYLPQPLELRSRVLVRDGRTVVLIYVGRHPSGCAIFHTTGQYERKGKMEVVFRAGDVFWRDGTRSVRISQQGFEEIIERRLADEKRGWLDEQHELRRNERAELQAAYESRGLADAALGSVNLDLPTETLTLAVLELIRSEDTIALRHLLNEAGSRARSANRAGRDRDRACRRTRQAHMPRGHVPRVRAARPIWAHHRHSLRDLLSPARTARSRAVRLRDVDRSDRARAARLAAGDFARLRAGGARRSQERLACGSRVDTAAA